MRGWRWRRPGVKSIIFSVLAFSWKSPARGRIGRTCSQSKEQGGVASSWKSKDHTLFSNGDGRFHIRREVIRRLRSAICFAPLHSHLGQH
ncbi:hypothetical protein LINPERHAP1_LOCUS34671 [Linum perenne]